MTYNGGTRANSVKFMVYDAAGNRANQAQLDSSSVNTGPASYPDPLQACKP